MEGQGPGELSQRPSQAEREARARLTECFHRQPLPDDEVLSNLGLFLPRQTLMRMLYLQELYLAMLPTPGVIMEFGVRWGQSLAVLTALRGIHEPYNYTRTLVGFDTFSGFRSVHARDGADPAVAVGNYAVTAGYADYLREVLALHEQACPLPHIVKHELVVGDVRETLPDYLARRPETLVALAIFDLDLYEPTKACLDAIRPHLTRGSVLAFDELASPTFPGETVALRETLGLEQYRLVRSRYGTYQAYLVMD